MEEPTPNNTNGNPPSKPHSTPPPTPSLRTLQSWLPIYLSNPSNTITRLNAILSTPSGTDTILSLLSYSTLFSSTLLTSLSYQTLHRTTQTLLDKAISLPPNTTVLLSSSLTLPSSRALITAKRLKALSALISDCRTFARLFGLLGIYQWGLSTLHSPPEDALLRFVAWIQVFANVFYQYLENGAYLSGKGIMGWSAKKQNRAWALSSRFWGLHIGLDFVRLLRLRSLRRVEKSKGDGVVVGEEQWKRNWRKELVVNAAFAPLAAHWSFEEGLLGEFWVGLLGSVAGVAKLRALWRNTS